MILQALRDYCERLPEDKVPKYGFNQRNIDFVFILNCKGELVQPPWTRLTEDGRSMLPVPFPAISVEPTGFRLVSRRTNQRAPYFLWDKTAFSLGREGQTIFQDRFEAFKKLHHKIGDGLKDAGMKALLMFLDRWEPELAEKNIVNWNEVDGKNITFQFEEDDRCFLFEHQRIKDAWLDFLASVSGTKIMKCLVCGRNEAMGGSHPPIRGCYKVTASQKAELALVSYNDTSLCSYGREEKERSLNAPISENCAFQYTSSLNFLLTKNSNQKVKIGDTTTVFWSEKPSQFESFLGLLFEADESQALNADLRLFFQAIRDGRMPQFIDDDSANKFYVLGISPNAARLAVRFWHVSTVGEMAQRIGRHFLDLHIRRSFDNEPEFPATWQLLRETAVQRKTENIPPFLAGALMRSILTGALYPQSLFAAVIGRIRADQEINYLRVSIIKACIARKTRLTRSLKEVTVELDDKNQTPAYLLGRLFAVLEKAQKDAVPEANTTIKDRYFGSASTTPRSVFPVLLRLAQHHIQKAKYGQVADKRIEEIICQLKEFPAHLTLEDQGLFTLGYYHQRQSHYGKKQMEEEVQS